MTVLDNSHKRFMIGRVEGGFIVINKRGEYTSHAYIASLGTCHNLIKWIDRKVLPKSSYLRESVYRLVGAEADTFVDHIRCNRHYVNVNKGA